MGRMLRPKSLRKVEPKLSAVNTRPPTCSRSSNQLARAEENKEHKTASAKEFTKMPNATEANPNARTTVVPAIPSTSSKHT